MEFSAATAKMLTELMRWRRDVRHFRTAPVPEDVLARLRQAMDYAPSVGNSRPWRVIRVESAALRIAMHEEFARCNAEAARVYDDVRTEQYARLKLAGLDTAPLQLAIFTEIDPSEGQGLGRQTIQHTLQQSTAMAVYALWLAARAENLGVGMVSILDPRTIRRLFDVPCHWEFSAYLCLGWPSSADDTPLLHRVGWQENSRTAWDLR